MTFRCSILAIVLLLTASCSSKLVVHEIDGPNVKARVALTGIPFKTKKTYQVTMYELQDGAYVPVITEQHLLADLEKVYSLNFKGAAFADSTAKVVLNDDATINEIDLSSTDKTAEALEALSAQGVAVATAVRDRVDARKKATQDREAALQAELNAQEKAAETALVTQEDSELTAVKAENLAKLALAQFAALESDATPAEVVLAENKVIEAMRQANIMARRAGLPLPYPN